MLRQANPFAVRGSISSSRQQAGALRATCLLCRVLWPIVVQHRHLLFAEVRKQKQPYLQGSTPEDTQTTGRLVFHYSEETSIDGSES